MPRKRAPRRSWTPAEDEKLLALRKEGLPLKEIGQRLGRHPEAVRSRLRRLGFPPSKTRRAWTPDEDARLRQLRVEGWELAELAAILRRTPASVKSRLSYLGLQQPGPKTRKPCPKTARFRRELAELYRQGLPLAEIARRLDVGPGCLKRTLAALHREGLPERPRTKPWTRQEVRAILRGHFIDGVPVVDLAMRLDRPVSSVRDLLRRYRSQEPWVRYGRRRKPVDPPPKELLEAIEAIAQRYEERA